MGEKFLIDTNVIIFYLEGALPKAAMQMINGIVDDVPNISVITKIELLGVSVDKAGDEALLEEFVSHSTIYGLSEEIADVTIGLRKQYKIKLPDAIIAATAVVHEFIVLTRNIKDFTKVKNLKLRNPFDNKENLSGKD